jgi:lysophospholipase L1-like esterase
MQTRVFSKYRGFLTRRSVAILSLGLLLTSITDAAANGQQREDSHEHWVSTWSTALHAPELVPGLTNGGFNDQTVRQIVHVSIGGKRVRLRLSTFGANAVVVDAAHIALSAGDSTIVAGSDRALTFGGKASIVIPAGAPVVSDPVELSVSDLANLAVSLFVSGATGPATWHFDSRQNSYISPPGDFTGTTVMPVDLQSSPTQSWFWLAGVDVLASRRSGAIAALGDSITDGDQSSVDENHRWTDELARRIVRQDEHAMGMLNEGMDGNRLLHDVLGANGLARFERDVLSQPGLAYVIVYLGTGDIGTGWPGGLNPDEAVTVDQILQAYKQLIEGAHTRGVKIYGATLTPFEGAFVPGTPFPLYSPENEMKRRQVNRWIRTSGAFDAVIDFDRVLRDPNAPSRLIPKYDSGDHVHANDDGYQAMADAIDLSLFTR